jgi:hypothetical protein
MDRFICESTYEILHPQFEELRRDVEYKLRTENAEVFDSLTNKMLVVMRMVDSVSDRVSSASSAEEGQLLE